MQVSLKWERSGDTLTAVALGRIDTANADRFEELMEAGLGPDDDKLIIDLERVSFLSSAGLRVFLIIARKFKAPGKRFAICSLSESIRMVVSVSGFDQIINVYESRAAAAAAFSDS